MVSNNVGQVNLSIQNNKTPLKYATIGLAVVGVALIATAIFAGVGGSGLGAVAGGALSKYKWALLGSGAALLVAAVVGFLAARHITRQQPKANSGSEIPREEKNIEIPTVSVDVPKAPELKPMSYHGGEYKGQVLNKVVPHGQGTSIDKDGNEYIGTWEDGNPTGEFTVKYKNGGEYKGELNKDLQAHGKGTYINKDENEYTGTWKGGSPTGGFTIKYKTGEEYEGELNKGLDEHGQGKLYDKEGNLVYEGEFQNGKCHGEGILYNKDETYYVGKFQNGKLHGTVGKWVDGIKYTSEWEDGKKMPPKSWDQTFNEYATGARASALNKYNGTADFVGYYYGALSNKIFG